MAPEVRPFCCKAYHLGSRELEMLRDLPMPVPFRFLNSAVSLYIYTTGLSVLTSYMCMYALWLGPQ